MAGVQKRVRRDTEKAKARPVTVFLTRHEVPPQPLSKFGIIIFFFRVQLTIISRIWWQVLLIALFTGGVVALNKYLGNIFYMEWPASLVPILGLVCGLLLVFRTNTAYDRYYEGRRLWSQMTQAIRTMTRWIWILVPEREAKDIIEKKSAINLLLAYAIASKHYLREEYSYNEPDLHPLIHHLPKMFPEPGEKFKKGHGAINYAPPTNIPLQLSYYIGIYINSIRQREKWDTSVSGMLLGSLNGLVECLTGFERIKRTPIPLAYSVHLYHVIWIYILALPFQLVAGLDWWTIPAVTLCGFTFCGILKIGSEIEDPFGYDENDLPLDDLCEVLRTEMNDIMGTLLPTSDDLYLPPDSSYFPIPGTNLSAKALARKTVVEVREILHQVAENPEGTKVRFNDMDIVGIDMTGKQSGNNNEMEVKPKRTVHIRDTIMPESDT